MKKDGLHKKIQRKMLLYLDHELPGKERDLVHDHMRGCSDCSGMLEFYERLWKKLPSAEKVPPPPYLWRKLQNRLDGIGKSHLFSLRLRLFIRRYANAAVFTALFSLAVAAGAVIGSPPSRPSFESAASIRQAVDLTEEFELDRFSIIPPGSLAGIFNETE
jgi:predicted anti-sigma-YlaC factor YlaD